MGYKNTLRVALPAGWGPLTPPEQSMAMAEQILLAEFEPLVAYDMQGNLIPLLATAWEASADLRSIEFTIDTSKRFSNGQYLTADIMKKSFEHSLAINPSSTNSSVLDVLNLVEGYEEYKQSGKLRGIEAPSNDKLVIRFNKPFRRALSFLSGIRYSAYIFTSDGRYLGTGPYQIATRSENEVVLTTNPYYTPQQNFGVLHITGLKNEEWNSAICNEAYDIYYSIDINKLETCGENRESDVDFTGGVIGGHVFLHLNGLPGRFFSDPKMRMAMQYLVVHHVFPKLSEHINTERLQVDPQFISQLQVGRLSTIEADRIINEGRQWVSHLIEYSKKLPIKFPLRDKKDLAILNILKDLGVDFQKNGPFISADEARILNYKTFDYDMRYGGAGYGAQDPDDLYHLLGQNGAISTPPIQRKETMAILEAGRSVITQNELNNTYQNLSATILKEVPAIHLGYLRDGFLYNHKRVSMKNKSMNSLSFNYTQFIPLTNEAKGGEK